MRSIEWQQLDDERKKIIEQSQICFPVKVGNIAKEFGIVVKSATLSAGISGEIKELENIVTIRINRHDVKERQRFTLAHEIAHFLLHRDRIGNGIIDDVLYRSGLSDILETQANKLAADILMPWHLIEVQLKKYAGLHQEAKFEKIAEEAEVSVTAIKIRLGKI